MSPAASSGPIVFAAGNDVRHIPRSADAADFWRDTQTLGVPRFVELARKTGVGRLVHLGSYYHQLIPDLADSNIYVQARKRADEGARALAAPDFHVCTINPPTIVGTLPGVPVDRYQGLIDWAAGRRPKILRCRRQSGPTGRAR
ncbi:hypothetical protein BH10PSE12_BH10PSE12_22810 [soil metagenome]